MSYFKSLTVFLLIYLGCDFLRWLILNTRCPFCRAWSRQDKYIKIREGMRPGQQIKTYKCHRCRKTWEKYVCIAYRYPVTKAVNMSFGEFENEKN